ncbi:MAG: DegV family protein [Acidimicrobiales bacterium]
MIGLCTDSNSQIPPELAERLGVEVVPLTVTIDGEPLLEGVDLGVDDFWARVESGTTSITTAAPSPGQFAAAYEALVVRGATEILSIHVSADVSSTLQAARLAAAGPSVPVRVVDSGTASFGVTCALWEAAKALASGSDVDEAAQAAVRVGRITRTVFVLGALEPARRGGRLDKGVAPGPGVPIFSMAGGKMAEVDRVDDLTSAVDAMAARIREPGGQLRRVAIGTADPGTERLAQALAERLRGATEVGDLLRYRIGPSVGAHTGPGTVGAYWYPVGS